MLRWATIASLVVLNISIWYGPLDTIRGKASDDREAQAVDTDAEVLANSGDLAGALTAYRAAVESSPKDPEARFAYALFCYMHAGYLRENAHWTAEAVVRTVRESFYAARELAPKDYEKASQYALYLMDQRFFGAYVTLDQVQEAWDHVIKLVEEHHAIDPGWRFYREYMSYALLQRARAAARFGDKESAAADLERVRTVAPDLRIPESLATVSS